MSRFEFNEIWKRKSLINAFAMYDLKIKYKNSFLGFFWSILEPLFILLVLYVVFTHVFKSGIENYPLYLFLGIILWGMFSRGTNSSLSSIISKSSIMTNIYFPREIPVLSSTITSFLIMMLEFVVFIFFIIIFQFVPPVSIFLLPVLLIPLFAIVLGVSLPLSVLNIHFRDFQYIWTVVLHAGFFAMPIIYKYEIFPDDLRNALLLIPIARILEMAHEVTLYGTFPSYTDWAYLIITSIGILGIGYLIFKKLETRVLEI